MDDDAFQRKQSLKVIISEFVMVIAVIITVCALAFIVSGYWLNSDFKIEQNGMLQISSTPSGADLSIDGESSWLRRTNTSKILSSGEHNIVLTKEGYDSWSKTINIAEGLLYRINYPRLFLQERNIEKVHNVTPYTYAAASPDRTRLLLAGDTSEWNIIDLRHEKLQDKKINIHGVLSGMQATTQIGLFTGEIISTQWSNDNERILSKIASGDKFEWILIDINNADNSINLSTAFKKDFLNVKLINRNEALAIYDNNLYKLDFRNSSISESLASNVYAFEYFGNEIFYSALSPDSKYYIGSIGLDGAQSDMVLYTEQPALIGVFKFYDELFIATVEDKELKLFKKDDRTNPVITSTLEFIPQSIKSGQDGEFVIAYNGPTIATLDMEANSVKVWQVDGENFGWVDNYMPYSVADGELYVYDFDGINKRLLAKNVSSRFPALVTENKWLYYVSDGTLIREQIVR